MKYLTEKKVTYVTAPNIRLKIITAFVDTQTLFIIIVINYH